MIVKAGIRERDEAARLIRLLWPDCDAEEEAENGTVFLYMEENVAIGFAKCGLRHDYVEGTDSSPVGYLEGIYVEGSHRGRGIAGQLLYRCEQWAKEQGCTQFASDCELDNTQSLAFHLGTGFTEANRIICFVKDI